MAEPSSSSSSSAAAAAAAPAASADASSVENTAAAARTEAADGAAGFTRLNIPFIIDRVNVTDPELIRMITTHPDVDRLHAVPTKDKPW